MAGKQTYPNPKPSTYPNKPGGGGGKAASYAGKMERADAHLNPGAAAAKALQNKNR